MSISPHINVLDEILDTNHLPIEFQLFSKFMFTSPFRIYPSNTDWQQFKTLTNLMINPQLHINTTDELETSVKNFQASLRTALKYSSTS